MPSLLSPAIPTGSPLHNLLQGTAQAAPSPGLAGLLGTSAANKAASSQTSGKDLLPAYDAAGTFCRTDFGTPLRPSITPIAQLNAPGHSGIGSLVGTGAVVRTYRVSLTAARAMALGDIGLKGLVKHDAAISDIAVLASIPGREVECIASADIDGTVLIHAFEVHGGADRFAIRMVARIMVDVLKGTNTPTFVRWHASLRGQIIISRGSHVWCSDLPALGVPEACFGLGDVAPPGHTHAQDAPAWLGTGYTPVNVMLNASATYLTIAGGTSISDMDVVSSEVRGTVVSAHGAPHHEHTAGWDVGDMVLAFLVDRRTVLYRGAGAADKVELIGSLPPRGQDSQCVRLLRCDTAPATTAARATARFGVVETAPSGMVLTSLVTDPATGTLHEDPRVVLDGPSARVLELEGLVPSGSSGDMVRLSKMSAGECGILVVLGSSSASATHAAVVHILPPAVSDITSWAGQWRFVRAVGVHVGQPLLSISLAAPMGDAAMTAKASVADGSAAACWAVATSSNVVELMLLNSSGCSSARLPLHELLLGGSTEGAVCQAKAARVGEQPFTQPALPQSESRESPNSGRGYESEEEGTSEQDVQRGKVGAQHARATASGIPHGSPAVRTAGLQAAAPKGSPPSMVAVSQPPAAAPAAAPEKLTFPQPSFAEVPAPAPSPAPVPSPSPVPAPVPVSISAAMPPAVSQSSGAISSAPASTGNTTVDSALAGMSEQLRVAVWQLSVDAGKREAKAAAEMKGMAEALASTLATQLPSMVEASVAKTLSPLGAILDAQHAAVLASLEDKVKAGLASGMGDLGGQLSLAGQIQPQIKAAMRQASQDMATALRTTAVESFKQTFEDTLLPAFERAVGVMVQQVQARMEADAAAVRSSIQASAESLQRAVSALETSVAAFQSLSGPVHGLVDSARSIQDQQAATAAAFAKAVQQLQGQARGSDDNTVAELAALRSDMRRLMEFMASSGGAAVRPPPLAAQPPPAHNTFSNAMLVSNANPQPLMQQQASVIQPQFQPMAVTPVKVAPVNDGSAASMLLAAAMRGKQDGNAGSLTPLLKPGAGGGPSASPAVPLPAPPIPMPTSDTQAQLLTMLHQGKVVEAIRSAVLAPDVAPLAFVVQFCASQPGGLTPGAGWSPSILLTRLAPFDRLCVLQRMSMLVQPHAGTPGPANAGDLCARGLWLEACVKVMIAANDSANEAVKEHWAQVSGTAKAASLAFVHTAAETAKGPMGAMAPAAWQACAEAAKAVGASVQAQLQ